MISSAGRNESVSDMILSVGLVIKQALVRYLWLSEYDSIWHQPLRRVPPKAMVLISVDRLKWRTRIMITKLLALFSLCNQIVRKGCLGAQRVQAVELSESKRMQVGRKKVHIFFYRSLHCERLEPLNVCRAASESLPNSESKLASNRVPLIK